MNSTPIVLVTGATSGIGRAVALDLARRGVRVFASGRNEAALTKLALESAGLPLSTVPLDVTREESILAARATIERMTDGHGVDVLVNNAGYGIAGALDEITDADLRAQFETNVFGLLAATRAFVPAMRARGRGRIVNIGSMGGRVTFPLFGAYHATKYAVEALSDAMRRELAGFGIKVSLIEPGAIHTGFADRTMYEFAKYRTGHSPYARVFAQAETIRARTDATAVDVSVVARVARHAALARFPRARYVVPFSARLVIALFSVLPTPLADLAMRLAVGLTRKNLAPAASAAAPNEEPIARAA